MKPVRYVALSSSLDVGFWTAFVKRKIEVDKLDERSLNLLGLYTTTSRPQIPPRLTLSGDFSYSLTSSPGAINVPVPVTLRNYNTREGFLAAPFSAWDADLTARAWAAVLSGRAFLAPHVLTQLGVFVFANLKTNKFLYRVSMPSLRPSHLAVSYCGTDAASGDAAADNAGMVPISQVLTDKQYNELLNGIASLYNNTTGNATGDSSNVSATASAPAAFIVHTDNTGALSVSPFATLAMLSDITRHYNADAAAADAGVAAVVCVPDWAKPAALALAASLASRSNNNCGSGGPNSSRFMLGFTDPALLTDGPGAPLRALLAAAALVLPAEALAALTVVCFRDIVSAAQHRGVIAATTSPVSSCSEAADAAVSAVAEAKSTVFTACISASYPAELVAYARASALAVVYAVSEGASTAAEASRIINSAVAAAISISAGSADGAANAAVPSRRDAPASSDDVAVDESRAVATTLRGFCLNTPISSPLAGLNLSSALAKWPAEGVSYWESDESGRARPRVVDLSAQLDKYKIMETSVDLNLKLMKWRLLPNLNLDTIASTKVLLVGSGTLGCNVARALLAWGVRDFTFIDNGRVSASNPVRQSLFTALDCADGGRHKALAAAMGLKAIFPGVRAKAVSLSIPMPGHGAGTAAAAAAAASTTATASAGASTAQPKPTRVPVPILCPNNSTSTPTGSVAGTVAGTGGGGAQEAACDEYNSVEFTVYPDVAAVAADALSALIAEADAVFLLTDSRESRWLPTVLCQAHDKLCVNAAMGFDSFVVMRHGARPLVKEEKKKKMSSQGADDAAASSSTRDAHSHFTSDLGVDWSRRPNFGCYFCADIVTPANSLKDRSLDQQCTVTRPGLSLVTSALAAELAIAVTQHRKRHRAAPISTDTSGHQHTNSSSSSSRNGGCANKRGNGSGSGLNSNDDDDNDDEDDDDDEGNDDGEATAGLGALPQQLRGSLYTLAQTAMRGEAHDACCGCGGAVVRAVREQGGAEFIGKVLQNASFLDEFSGLAEIRRKAEEAAAAWDPSDFSDDDDGESDGNDDGDGAGVGKDKKKGKGKRSESDDFDFE